ncbi:MAG: glycosyltransferase family 39 protein [Candidatus Promineofilum sp.]|nr:glycosyltransferase family 39 protein [Promineifilum sp.]
MNDLTLYRPAPPAHPGRELLRALVRRPATWAVLITLLGFGLRVWALERVPPGWRDDELIETLVISQNILDGNLAFYYPDASGHEALYHALNAIFLAFFGPTGLGIRLLSAFLGTLAVSLTYALGRRMFGAAVGLSASALLAVAFWGLMYSRVGIRHSLTPVLALAAFYWFWRAMAAERGSRGDRATGRPGTQVLPRALSCFLAAGLFLGLGFHAYFASRGAPLIPAAFVVYVLLVAPSLLRSKWPGLALMAGLTALVAAPLLLAVAVQPEAEGRVGELALPLVEARAGNFGPIIDHAVAALTMTHAGGDPEWLYNIPERPIFGPPGAIFFWVGVALAGWRAFRPLKNRVWRTGVRAEELAVWPDNSELAAAFLLIWWLVGISPAVLSVPPASMGHVILAQPAFYLLAALPIGALAGGSRRPVSWRLALAGSAAVSLFAATALRDIPAYFVEWPSRGMVRFLYHADVEDVADFIRRDPAAPWPVDFGITGPLAGPWNRIALELALGDAGVRPRWYNPERALLLWPDVSFSGYPAVDSPYASVFDPLPQDALLLGGYTLARVAPSVTPMMGAGQLWLSEAPVCFANGLCWTSAGYNPTSGVLELEWRVAGDLALPDMPLISNPPPPGVYAGLRLSVFAQLLNANGDFLVGDDGLWVDPETLRDGDVFLQRHYLRPPDGSSPAAIVFGLYDPMTGQRILLADGQDHLPLDWMGQP